ncbi:hypothetical protein ACEPAF_120 [Sanghuangporus sanghuang]
MNLQNCLHAITFRFPSCCAVPRTLCSLLMEGADKHSLNNRIAFAIKQATSVLVVHLSGLVHKNIKPNAILIMESIVGEEKKLYPYKLGKPYLLSSDSSRSSRGPTMKRLYQYPSGADWETLYTHTAILVRDSTNTRCRDVFSPGVYLLELALWKSFFRWSATKGKYEDDTEVIDLTPAILR